MNYISDLGVPDIEILGDRSIDSPLHLVMNIAFLAHGFLFAAAAIYMARGSRFPLRVPIIACALVHALGMVLIAVVNGGQHNNELGLGWIHLLGAFLAFFGGHLTAICIGISLLLGRRSTYARRLLDHRRIGLIGILGIVMLQVDVRAVPRNVFFPMECGSASACTRSSCGRSSYRNRSAQFRRRTHTPLSHKIGCRLRLITDPNEATPIRRKVATCRPTSTESHYPRSCASDHGLDIVPETITVNELGLDFQVAIAEAVDGQSWVLRIPRRPDVTDRAAVEGRFLQCDCTPSQRRGPRLADPHAGPHRLSRCCPVNLDLTIDEQGQPQWHFDVEADEYAQSLGDFLAELHSRRSRDRSHLGH